MTFEAFYKKFNRTVFNQIKRRIKDEMIAEELAADVMIKVYKKLDQFDQTKAQLTTWIFNIVKNTLIDHYRKKNLSTVSFENVFAFADGEEAEIDHLMELKDSSKDAVEQLIEEESNQIVMSKFEVLSETEKLIATLRLVDGLSYIEIAEKMNMPIGTVKAKVHFARKKLVSQFSIAA